VRFAFCRVLLLKTDRRLVCEDLMACAAGTLAFPATGSLPLVPWSEDMSY